MASNKQLAESFKLMCRYAMTVIIDAESKEATAVFYGGELATEPCLTRDDAPDAACRAIARCAGMAEKMLATAGVATVAPALLDCGICGTKPGPDDPCFCSICGAVLVTQAEADEHARGVEASEPIFRRGVSELAAVIESLRDTGRFADEEGEATDALDDLLRQLTDGVAAPLKEQP